MNHVLNRRAHSLGFQCYGKDQAKLAEIISCLKERFTRTGYLFDNFLPGKELTNEFIVPCMLFNYELEQHFESTPMCLTFSGALGETLITLS
ncbi:MAG: hypothetical protein QXU22_04015 [Desulfurococcaceae archaeon]